MAAEARALLIAELRQAGQHSVDFLRACEWNDHTSEHDAHDIAQRLEDAIVAADLLGRPVSPASPPQVLKDAKEIVSAYGFLLMRMAVAKDAQDAYDISKREFEETRETLDRLHEALRDVPIQRPAKTDPLLVSEDGNTTNDATRSGESRDAPASVSTRPPE